MATCPVSAWSFRSGLFPPWHADPPDVGQLAQVLPERLFTMGGKSSGVRAKSGKLSGHLPFGRENE